MLKPALKEVNLFGAYNVQMERRRAGRQVGWIIQSWWQKDYAEMKEAYSLVAGHSATRAAAAANQGTEIIVVDPDALPPPKPPQKLQQADPDPFSDLVDDLPL